MPPQVDIIVACCVDKIGTCVGHKFQFHCVCMCHISHHVSALQHVENESFTNSPFPFIVLGSHCYNLSM
jgi:hypothetical protein